MAVACGALSTVVATVAQDRDVHLWGWFGFFAGLFLAGLTWLELVAAARATTTAARAGAVAGLGALAGVLSLVALVQAVYTAAMVDGRSAELAGEQALKLLREVRQRTDVFLFLVVAFGLTFGASAWTRVAGLPLRFQVVLGGAAAAAGALLFSASGSNQRGVVGCGAILGGLGVGLPLLAALADAVERRLWPPEPA